MKYNFSVAIYFDRILASCACVIVAIVSSVS